MFFDYTNTEREWKANWIWNSTEEANEWVCFRKKINVDKVPSSVIANISVESRYWLYVNGKLVIFEGSLKRGPNANDGYFDEVELAPHLVKGENTIAILCWYWGMKSFSYSCSFAGKAGFIFEAKIGKNTIISDDTWKVCKNTAYIHDDGSVPGISETQPNYRLPECNVFYDARHDIGEWEKPEYDDSKWANATVLGQVPCAPWNKLHRRPIPFLKDYGLKDYNNSADFIGHTTKKTERLDLYLDYNAQLTPYIKLKTDIEGLKIDIRTDNYFDPANNGYSVKNGYMTKKGEQEFEGLSWMPGQHVYYTIPAGVTILSLKFRESGYNAEFRGYFKCDDEFFNKLWIQSERTLYVTMRDNFMDCPDRERAQWWGDVTNEMMEFMYCLDTNAYALYEKGLYTKMGYADSKQTTKLYTVCPSHNDITELPMQEMAGICGMWEYYLYTGNKKALEDVYKYAYVYLIAGWHWYIRDNGLINRYTGSWDWPDWGDNADFTPLENAWYVRAIKTLRKMAGALGKANDLTEINDRIEKITKAYDRFWTGKGYKSSEAYDYDDRANAVAVLAHMVPDERKADVLEVLKTRKYSSPYMEKYVLDAMYEIGSMKDIQERIKDRYYYMTASEQAYSTLWEFWDKNAGTKNHAWSGGPLITMSKFMAGIRPLEPGYEVYTVSPDMGELKHIEALVPSVRGDIKVTLNRDANDTLSMDIEAPANAEGIVSVPSFGCAEVATIYVNDVKVVDHGTFIGGIDNVKYNGKKGKRYEFSINGGKWNFKSTK